MSKRIAVVTGDSGECYETLYALHRFAEEGWDAVLAAPSKKRLNLVQHDFEEGWDTYIERPGYRVMATAAIDELQPSNFDAVLILGGRAPEFLRHNAALIAFVREMSAAGKWVLAICHGIQVLVAAGLVKERQVTCYEHVRYEVEMAGGTWCKPEAVRDGKMITAQTWQSHPDFYREVVRALRGA